MVSVGLPLRPGETRVVTWSMVTGEGQTGPTEVSVTPGRAAGERVERRAQHLLTVRDVDRRTES